MVAKAVADAVQARLAANWMATVIIDYDTQASPPDLDAFLVHQYPVANGSKPFLDRRFFEEGGIRFVLNVRRGIGLAQGLQWTDELAALFREVKFGGIECFVPVGPVLDDNNEEGDWISYAVIVPYRYQFFSPQIIEPNVTLQAIDGGGNYYSLNGFANAVGMGWDDPSFFPIGVFNANLSSDSDALRLVDLGVNAVFGIGPSFMDAATFARFADNDLSLIAEVDEADHVDLAPSALYWVGISGVDEATTFDTAFADYVTVKADNKQNHRFWYWNGNWFFFLPIATYGNGGLSPYEKDEALTATALTPGSTPRHINLASTDLYWFAGAKSTPPLNLSAAKDLYGLASDITVDQARRSCRYGDMVDFMRATQAGGFPAPVAQFIENGGPYVENTTGASYIKPAEMNAAIWASIIHGARVIIYFNHTFGGPEAIPDISTDNFGHAYFQTIQPGESISIYDQAKATNQLIASLASVINSPFALDYATVSPPAVVLSASQVDSGFDIMVKFHNVVGGDDKFYIFAVPRYSNTLLNQLATFTIQNTGASQVTVINESRTISITNGGTQFIDSFATSDTVHIYRID